MERRLWNQSLPQTLMGAVFLLYANVVIALLFRTGNQGVFGLAVLSVLRSPRAFDLAELLGNLLALAFVVGSAGAGYLIANERRLGYRIAVPVAAAPLLALLVTILAGWPRRQSIGAILSIGTLFDLALFVLLLHNQSKEYVRIWFR